MKTLPISILKTTGSRGNNALKNNENLELRN